MKRGSTPFWKQPRGMIVLGLGGVLLLATAWLGYTRLGPAPAASAQAPPPRPRMDENALIAAHAERPGSYAAAEPANAIQASADTKLEGDDAAAAAPGEPAEPDRSRFDPNEIIADAEAAVDEAVEEVEAALEGKDEGE